MDGECMAGKVLQVSTKIASTVWEGFATMATNTKSARLVKKIGTHNGIFHCDEALACYMLKTLPEYADAEIVRTRDQKILDTCDIVVDVGSEYNPKRHRYDHHQRDFEHSLSSVRPDLAKNKFIRLSSAGLIYAHFGIEVIEQILKKEHILPTTESIQCLYLYIYDVFIEELDAIDNGVPMFPEGKPNYRINSHLSARVQRLNPQWNSPNPESSDYLFTKAMDLVGVEFKERTLEAAQIWWPAREVVKKAILSRKNVHESGEIIFLEEICPWKEHLFALEEELGIEDLIKFCIFQDNVGSWRVQSVPVQPDSFICRVFLHKDWRGIRDDELISVSGIDGCIFCHHSGFIGGNKTRKGALQMALVSLKTELVNRE